MHYCDNIEYRDILTHDNRHQLFLISPIPSIEHVHCAHYTDVRVCYTTSSAAHCAQTKPVMQWIYARTKHTKETCLHSFLLVHVDRTDIGNTHSSAYHLLLYFFPVRPSD